MNGFPWGLLVLILFVLDLLLTGIYFLRKRMLKSLCRRALARGDVQEVARLMHEASEKGLIQLKDYMAWLQEFGMEEYG
jgi:hypothetical protein